MKTKKKLLINYLFSIGFIFLIVIFLSSMVFISRTVLSNTQIPIVDHVKNTQNILDDILEVETLTKSSKKLNHTFTKKIKNLNYLESNISNLKIFKPAYININENKSIFTFFIDGEILELNNSYYKKIKNTSKILNGQMIVYNENKIGEILEIHQNNLKVLNDVNNKIENINLKDILGIVILKK